MERGADPGSARGPGVLAGRRGSTAREPSPKSPASKPSLVSSSRLPTVRAGTDRTMDVNKAFLHGDSQRGDVYLATHDGFDEREGMVCKLDKPISSLERSPRAWNEKIHAHLLSLWLPRLPRRPRHLLTSLTRVWHGSSLLANDLILTQTTSHSLGAG